MTDQSQPMGWVSPPVLVPPLRFSLETTMSPDAAAVALATAVREKRYVDPLSVDSPFLRLTGTETGPRINLDVKLYVLPGVPSRGPWPRLRGEIVARAAGAELVLELVPEDHILMRLPLVGPSLVEAEHRRLASQGEVLRRFLAEILAG